MLEEWERTIDRAEISLSIIINFVKKNVVDVVYIHYYCDHCGFEGEEMYTVDKI